MIVEIDQAAVDAAKTFVAQVDNRFLLSTNHNGMCVSAVDLKAISGRLSEEQFRDYIAASRLLRAAQRTA